MRASILADQVDQRLAAFARGGVDNAGPRLVLEELEQHAVFVAIAVAMNRSKMEISTSKTRNELLRMLES